MMLVDGSNTPCLREEPSANSRLLPVKLRQQSVSKMKAIDNDHCYKWQPTIHYVLRLLVRAERICRVSCIKINSPFNLHDDVKKRRADNIAVNFSITILCKMQHYNLLKLDILVANES